MVKFYRLDKEEVIDTVTEIPQEMWEKKQLLPYEKVVNTVLVDEPGEEESNLDIQEDKVIETITRYRKKPTLDELKENKKSDVLMWYENQTQQGFECSNGIKVDCRDKDKVNWLALRLGCIADPETPVTIRDFNNQIHSDITPSNVLVMVGELEAHYKDLFYQKWTKEQAIVNCQTEEELTNINLGLEN